MPHHLPSPPFFLIFFSLLPQLPSLPTLPALPNPNPDPPSSSSSIQPQQTFLPNTSPPSSTVPSFPEQSAVSGCPLHLPEPIFPAVKASCTGSAHLSKGKCCPVLASWLYSSYSQTALRHGSSSSKEQSTTSYDMPLLPDDSETCVDRLDKMMRDRGVVLEHPNSTCDVIYCYCGIRLHQLSCPQSFHVSGDGKLTGDDRLLKLEHDCLSSNGTKRNHHSTLSGCSKCLTSLFSAANSAAELAEAFFTLGADLDSARGISESLEAVNRSLHEDLEKQKKETEALKAHQAKKDEEVRALKSKLAQLEAEKADAASLLKQTEEEIRKQQCRLAATAEAESKAQAAANATNKELEGTRELLRATIAGAAMARHDAETTLGAQKNRFRAERSRANSAAQKALEDFVASARLRHFCTSRFDGGWVAAMRCVMSLHPDLDWVAVEAAFAGGVGNEPLTEADTFPEEHVGNWSPRLTGVPATPDEAEESHIAAPGEQPEPSGSVGKTE